MLLLPLPGKNSYRRSARSSIAEDSTAATMAKAEGSEHVGGLPAGRCVRARTRVERPSFRRLGVLETHDEVRRGNIGAADNLTFQCGVEISHSQSALVPLDNYHKSLQT